MTPDEQISKLEARVDRLEDLYRADIVAIHAKLDTLASTVNRAFVKAAENSCPAPGSCLVLSESLKNTIVAHNATMLRVERLELRMIEDEKKTSDYLTLKDSSERFTKHEDRIASLERWQSKVFGMGVVALIVFNIAAPWIRKLLNID